MLKEIELIEDAHELKNFRFPLKIDKVIQIVVLSGRMSCLVDLKAYSLQAPAMAILLPGQVLESLEYDEEFKTLTMIMSKGFTDSFNLPVSLQERLFIQTNHFHPISQEVLEVYLSCFNQIKNVIKQKDNPYRREIIKCLFSAYYYGLGYYIHNANSENKQTVVMTYQQELCERFITLVSENYKEKREIGYYADKLCVSNKYLSSLLKQETGLTALQWIEKYVVLYAKSCLSSTSMTVQQISDELFFPSQSVFGKYFKRVEGISPKQYRQSLNN
jgi:AraC-like DNA-binding protein